MNTQKLLIIRDNAHGVDVPGKRSPDGTHQEWLWSRERWNEIETILQSMSYAVVDTNPSDIEIGIYARRGIANTFAKQHPDKVPLLISLHNDASGNTPEWRSARGVSVWTTRGFDRSDIYAAEMIKAFDPITRGRTRMRRYDVGHGHEDFEADFVVLTGDYSAMLIECCFQDNRDDVALLRDRMFNKRVEDAVVTGIERITKLIDPNYKTSYEN